MPFIRVELINGIYNNCPVTRISVTGQLLYMGLDALSSYFGNDCGDDKSDQSNYSKSKDEEEQAPFGYSDNGENKENGSGESSNGSRDTQNNGEDQ